jgi:16S rRNA processing protein RimM
MLICVATIIGTHGIRGKLKLRCFDDVDDYIVDDLLSDEVGNFYSIIESDRAVENLIVSIEGVNSYDDAKALVGKKLYIARDKLPTLGENEYYYGDLVDVKIFLKDGAYYGMITNVYNFGAGDVIDIVLENGKELMLPFNKEVFLEVGVENKTAIIEEPHFIEA